MLSIKQLCCPRPHMLCSALASLERQTIIQKHRGLYPLQDHSGPEAVSADRIGPCKASGFNDRAHISRSAACAQTHRAAGVKHAGRPQHGTVPQRASILSARTPVAARHTAPGLPVPVSGVQERRGQEFGFRFRFTPFEQWSAPLQPPGWHAGWPAGQCEPHAHGAVPTARPPAPGIRAGDIQAALKATRPGCSAPAHWSHSF